MTRFRLWEDRPLTFDQSVLIWCVVVPAVVALVIGGAARLLPLKLRPVAIGLGWWVAITVPLFMRQQWQWWPEDSWRQALWPLLGWSLLIVGSAPALRDSLTTNAAADPGGTLPVDAVRVRWWAAAVLAVLTALVALPRGESWSDLYELHRPWMALVTISVLTNGVAFESFSQRRAARWSLLVALAGLACPLVLAMANYGSLAEWGTAMVAATLGVALLTLSGLLLEGWACGLVAVAAASVMTVNVRFYTFETYPGWVYAAALFLPTAVVTIDTVIPQERTGWRVAIAASGASIVVAAVVYRVMLM